MTLSRSTVLGFAGLLALAAGLYLAKTEAERVRERVGDLQVQLVEERKALRIAEAELVWRAAPARIETAARTLGLEPVVPGQVITVADLSRAPVAAAALAGDPVAAAAAARARPPRQAPPPEPPEPATPTALAAPAAPAAPAPAPRQAPAQAAASTSLPVAEADQ